MRYSTIFVPLNLSLSEKRSPGDRTVGVSLIGKKCIGARKKRSLLEEINNNPFPLCGHPMQIKDIFEAISPPPPIWPAEISSEGGLWICFGGTTHYYYFIGFT